MEGQDPTTPPHHPYVLLVDANDERRSILAAVIGSAGAVVREVASGPEASALIKRTQLLPDAVVWTPAARPSQGIAEGFAYEIFNTGLRLVLLATPGDMTFGWAGREEIEISHKLPVSPVTVATSAMLCARMPLRVPR